MLKKIFVFSLLFHFTFYVFSQTVNPQKDWKLGIQLWTFNTSSFYTAIKKVDSCKLKYAEAYLGQVLPPDAAQVISKTLTEVTKNAGGAKLTIGILLTLWFASGGMTSMISGLNGVYEVREGRSFVKVRLIALGLTVAISVLIFTALIAILTGDFAASYLGSHLGLGKATVIMWHILQIALALLFVILSFSLIYYYGPDLKEQHWYWITPGALIGVLLWVTASFGFRLYLHFFNSYSKTYGSLGAAMILLMWLYITGFSFLMGGEINAQIEHAAALRGHPEAKAPGEKKAA